MDAHSPRYIFDCDSVSEFLSLWLAEAKRQDPDFSLGKLARAEGINSQSLVEVVKGRKQLSPELAAKLCGAMKLSSSEQAYLGTLIHYTYATNETEKQWYATALQELRRSSGRAVVVEDQSVFSHWVHMAILSMSKVKGFACNPDTIREFLCDEVDEASIEEAVERLLRLGLLKFENGNLRADHANTVSRNDAYRRSPHNYFHQVSELAKKGADLPAEEREFQCFSLAIDRAQLPMFKTMLRDFRDKICAAGEKAEADQVYQCNLQFFPITRALPLTEPERHVENSP